MTSSDTVHFTRVPTAHGPLLLAATDAGLVHVNFQKGTHPRTPDLLWVEEKAPRHKVLQAAARQFTAYFAGALRDFDLPLAPAGTAFQQKVWKALCGIPYGRTITYGELARRVGKPTAARAVGAANGQNPLPVIVPCHRVIGADGSLTGYGEGLPIKQALLELEGALDQPSLFKAAR
jgi:methylated-DNA-[protein]-cysteine S-methyltransferase